MWSPVDPEMSSKRSFSHSSLQSNKIRAPVSQEIAIFQDSPPPPPPPISYVALKIRPYSLTRTDTVTWFCRSISQASGARDSGTSRLPRLLFVSAVFEQPAAVKARVVVLNRT